jgi:autotransporter-associated beta strand protein
MVDVSDSDLIFTGKINTYTINDATANSFVQSIVFKPDAGHFVLTGTAIQLDGGGSIINASPNTQIISFLNQADFGSININNLNFNTGRIIPYVYFNALRGDLIFGSDLGFGSQVTIVFQGAHNTTINGAIYNAAGGDGSLLVAGPGNVYLNGMASITGNTVVSGGKLVVNGSLSSYNNTVNTLGTLAGHGVLFGNVNNFGNVSPGDPHGALAVGGRYLQGPSSTLTMHVTNDKPGQYSTLTVGGQATLAGDLRIVKTGPGVLRPGKSIDIVTAGGGVVGSFDDVTYASNTISNTKVVYSSNAVSLEGQSGYFAQFAQDHGLTPNQTAVAHGLDKIAFRNTQPKLISFLNNETINKLPEDFDKIAPDELTSIFTMSTALANVQTANLQRRTEDLRSGSHGFSASGFATAGSGPLYSGGVTGPNGNDGKDTKEMKNVVPPEDRWGVFITGVGEWVNVHGDENARGYDITTGGFTLGVDYKVTPNFAIGLMAGYAATGSDLNNGGRVFVNSGRAGLYSTYFTGGFYVDTAVTGGYNSYDTRRDGLRGTARGDTDGGELNVLFATGYDWKVGGLTFGPTASFQYTYVGISDFTERGSLAPLAFRSQHQDSLRSAFGFKASFDWHLGGVVVRPEVRAAWQHEFGDNDPSIDSSFDGGGGDLFSVTGPRIGRDSLLLGAGFAVLWNERTSTYVYYDGELARARYNAQNVSGGVRVSF